MPPYGGVFLCSIDYTPSVRPCREALRRMCTTGHVRTEVPAKYRRQKMVVASEPVCYNERQIDGKGVGFS